MERKNSNISLSNNVVPFFNEVITHGNLIKRRARKTRGGEGRRAPDKHETWKQRVETGNTACESRQAPTVLGKPGNPKPWISLYEFHETGSCGWSF